MPPTRGFHLAYSPGFRDGIVGGYGVFGRADQAEKGAGLGV